MKKDKERCWTQARLHYNLREEKYEIEISFSNIDNYLQFLLFEWVGVKEKLIFSKEIVLRGSFPLTTKALFKAIEKKILPVIFEKEKRKKNKVVKLFEELKEEIL